MKKGAAIFAILFIVSAVVLISVFAAASSETEGVQKAYQCVNNVIQSKTCNGLSTQEKIFSLASVGKCKPELYNDSFNDTCWPKGKCTPEMTAKAVVALKSVGANVDKPVKWLQSQKDVSPDLNWYLEVDSNRPVSCTVGYEDPTAKGSNTYNQYPFKIGGDKLINQNAGNCLELSNGGYWYQINPACYKTSFEISCNESFISTLLFQEAGSSTYHVSGNPQGASEGGKTLEKTDSYCLLNSRKVCDYLGTLWGSAALKIAGENITDYLPYLITSRSLAENEKYLPNSFLYLLTNNLQYKSDLLYKQSMDGFWKIPGGVGKFYDTALALLPFQGQDLPQKNDAKTALFKENVQGADGCWDNGNLVSTEFLIYSIWPRGISNGGGGNGGVNNSLCTTYSDYGFSCVNSTSQCSGTTHPEYECDSDGTQICCEPSNENGGGGTQQTCETAGYNCISSSQCDTLSRESSFDSTCPPFTICCSAQPQTVTCSDEGGQICSSDEHCSGGNTLSTDDLQIGEKCCIEPGTCEKKVVETPSNKMDCENNLGYCNSDSSCGPGFEATTNYTCPTSTDICCIQSNNSSHHGGSYWWLWVLFALVILTTLGIIYREKLREYLERWKAKKGGKGSGHGGSTNGPRGPPPRFPPRYSRATRLSPGPPRRIIPQQRPSQQRFVPKKKSPKELDEVLKKLKEIGK